MLKGIDVSKYQGDINYDALKSAIDFIIIRSSYGVGYTDTKFQRNRDEAKRVGLLTGFYHYAYPNNNTPKAEADWFLKVLGTVEKGQILFLDFEEKYVDPIGWSLEFLHRITEVLGYKPLIYLNQAQINSYDWSPLVKEDYGLWIAQYNSNPPIKSEWPFTAFKQFTSSGQYPGISGNVDGDEFYGDQLAFLKYGFGGSDIINPMDPSKAKAILNLDTYRQTRVQGPEGNYEGYVNAIIGSDRDNPKLKADLDTTLVKLSQASTALETADTQLQVKDEAIDSLKKQLKIATDKLTELSENPPVVNPVPVFKNPVAAFFYKLALFAEK